MLSLRAIFLLKTRWLLATALLLAAAPAVRAQDPYFSQPFATRQYANPAYTGLVDDYSVTLAYRNQFPSLVGTFQTFQAAADLRPDQPGQHHAFGLLINQDQTGELTYRRLEAGGLYAYHTRLTKTLALSAGGRLSYGRQTLGNPGYVFGDQLATDGSIVRASSENTNYLPVNYFSLGFGGVLYSAQGFFSLAGQHLNQPDLGFRQPNSSLPLLLNFSGGYKFFTVRPGLGLATREISFTPVATYARQGGSQRLETGLYFTASPVTLGAVVRNIFLANGVGSQQVLALVVGVQTGGLRLGYSYDVGLSQVSSSLGGAHEISLAVYAFDKLENAHRRLRKRNYPAAPCPAF